MSDSPVVQGWMDQGSVRTRQEDLLRTIEIKFQTAPPADLVELIQQNNSLKSLAGWRDAALLASTLDAFRLAIRPAGGQRNGANGP
jgi:hypothetical protein